MSIVLDEFGYELHLGDTGASHRGDHHGRDFVAAAVAHGVDVRIVDTVRTEVDLRRTSADDLVDAAEAGALFGARVRAYGVALL